MRITLYERFNGSLSNGLDGPKFLVGPSSFPGTRTFQQLQSIEQKLTSGLGLNLDVYA